MSTRKLDSYDSLTSMFALIRKANAIALAVSGGPDSTALMLLFAKFAVYFPGLLDSWVFTVDHRLRLHSSNEAKEVNVLANTLGLHHKTLSWQRNDNIASNIQMTARKARYNLLVDACINHKIEFLLTAHTQDDQAETFLLALSRGSGIYGLASMPQVRQIAKNVTLVRPLLNITKAELIDYLNEQKVPWITDPSNCDPRFTRTKIRNMSKCLSSIGLSKSRLAKTAHAISRVVEVMNECVTQFLEKNTILQLSDVIMLSCANFLKEHNEIIFRALAICLRKLSRHVYSPRMSKLEFLVNELRNGLKQHTYVKRTLSGVCLLLTWKNRNSTNDSDGNLWMSPEIGRNDFGELVLYPGEQGIWGGRFRVHIPNEIQVPCSIKTLRHRSVRQLRQSGLHSELTDSGKLILNAESISTSEFPTDVMLTIPGIYVGDQLVAVPTFGFAISRDWSKVSMETVPSHKL